MSQKMYSLYVLTQTTRLNNITSTVPSGSILPFKTDSWKMTKTYMIVWVTRMNMKINSDMYIKLHHHSSQNKTKILILLLHDTTQVQ